MQTYRNVDIESYPNRVYCKEIFSNSNTNISWLQAILYLSLLHKHHIFFLKYQTSFSLSFISHSCHSNEQNDNLCIDKAKRIVCICILILLLTLILMKQLSVLLYSYVIIFHFFNPLNLHNF